MKRLGTLYGTMPLAEFQVEQQKQIDLSGQVLPLSLREDWAIRTDAGGDFQIRYTASCSACKWSFDFQHDESAYNPQDEPGTPDTSQPATRAPGANTP